MINSTTTSSPRIAVWGAVLAACVLAAYANSFNGVFQFDDLRSIQNNASLHSLTAPGKLFSDPESIPRPVVALTFAIDYALFGTKPAGYHAFNVAAHLIAALLLFGIVRRTLLSEKLRARFESSATPLAFAVALVWALHPLQTEAVTYLVQRAESMMGMFFLLALYCAIRGAGSTAALRWTIGAIAAAAVGAGCKQVIVVLPVVVLLYDRCFISGTFKAAWKRAPALHAGLCVCWVIVLVLLLRMSSVAAAGFGIKQLNTLNYVMSQAVVIFHYLRLAFWPAGLVLDYDWKIERDWSRIAPCGIVLLALLGATIWQLRKNAAFGFVGAWFFLTLAPTSSVMPIADLAVEHRMYLALAAVVVAAVFAVHFVAGKLFQSAALPAWKATLMLFAAMAIALGAATYSRNVVYADYLGMLDDIVAKRPLNPRAYSMIAMDAMQKGDGAKALSNINKTVELRPNLSETHHMKGDVLAAQHDVDGAIASYQAALKINPKNTFSWVGLSDMWMARHKDNTAILRIANALKRTQSVPEIHQDMGNALAAAGQFNDAIFEFNQVLRLQPENEAAIVARGRVYELSGRESEAIASYRAAMAENPDRLGVGNALAWILATSPNDALRNGAQAVALAERASTLTQNKHPLFLDTLGAAYAEVGQFDKAAAAAENALKQLPTNAPLVKEIQAHVALYKTGKPIRDKK